MWYVYILECSDETYYTGATNDLERRLAEHNNSDQGAKYTRARRPVRLVYAQRKKNRSYALKEEARIKAMPRRRKTALIKSAAK